MNRQAKHIQDDNGIQVTVFFRDFPQSLADMAVDSMNIVIDRFKPAEISGDAIIFFENEILCQKKH